VETHPCEVEPDIEKDRETEAGTDVLGGAVLMVTFVYGLYEGFSNTPFYIGVTQTPKRRLWCHKAALGGKRKDSLTGWDIDPEDVTMRLLAQCDDRGHAETIEKALQVHYEIHIVRSERLVK
jgi:predicted GIY-YIG superfamily endonuclease